MDCGTRGLSSAAACHRFSYLPKRRVSYGEHGQAVIGRRPELEFVEFFVTGPAAFRAEAGG